MADLSGKNNHFWAFLGLFAKMTFLPPSEIFSKWNRKRPKLGNFDIILIAYEVYDNLNAITPNFMILEIVLMEEMCSGKFA